ncbi:MAG: hypothetical protein KAS90_00045 [Candidatus Aenigmarchaeota archaeon]|nr:hypothetical protein [Candidatus Aenigmarchaeota archaeon]
MFDKSDSKGNDEKIDNLIDEFKEFRNKRKIIELDLEKKMLSLEGVFEKIKKNIDIIQGLEDADSLKDIKSTQETLRSIEDLTLTDRLEIIQNKETIQEFSKKIAVFNKKIDLMSNALKIFDEKIKNGGGSEKSTASDSDFVTVLDELSKIKETISGLEKKKPVGETEFNRIHDDFEKVNTDFATLISGVREELGSYDKKIGMLTDEIERTRNIDTSIGESENSYRGMLDLIKKMQAMTKILTEKSDKSEVSIRELEKDTGMKIKTLAKNMEKLIKIVDTTGTGAGPSTGQEELDRGAITNIELKVAELDSAVSNMTSQIEEEKTYTNQKISNAMDAIKDMLKRKGDKTAGIDIDIDTEHVKEEIDTIKGDYKRKLDSEIKNITHANEEIKKKVEDISEQIVLIRSLPDKSKAESSQGHSDKKISNMEEISAMQTKINRILKEKIDDIEKNIYVLGTAVRDTKDNIDTNREHFNSNISEKLGNLAMPDIDAELKERDSKIKEIEQKSNDSLNAVQDKVYNILSGIQKEITMLREVTDTRNNSMEDEFKDIKKFNKDITATVGNMADMVKKEREEENIKVQGKIDSLNKSLSTIENKILEDRTDTENRHKNIKGKICTIEGMNNKLVDNILKSVSTIKNLKEMINILECSTKERIENIEKENRANTDETRNAIDRDRGDISLRIRTIEHGHKKSIEMLEKNIKESKKDIEIDFKALKNSNLEITSDIKEMTESVRKSIEKESAGYEKKFEENRRYIDENIKHVTDLAKAVEDSTRENNIKDIESLKDDTDTKITLIEEKIIQHKQEMNKNLEQVNDVGKEIVSVVKNIDEALETSTAKTFIRKLEELEKTREALKAESLNDFLIRFGEMKILKEKITEDFKDLKGTVFSLQSKVEGGLEKKVENELSNTLENVKSITGTFTKTIEESEKRNDAKMNSLESQLTDSLSKIEKAETQLKEDISNFRKMQIDQTGSTKNVLEESLDRKLRIFADEQKRKINYITNEEIKDIVEEQDRKLSEMRNELKTSVDAAKNGFESSQKGSYTINNVTEDTKAFTDIQAKINKVMKEKINNIEKKISDNRTSIIPENNNNIIEMIALLRKENKMLSGELKDLKEQLANMGHTGRAEGSPLILE